MLVAVGLEELIKQLESVAHKSDQAFIHMVSRFTENVVMLASERTRIGSQSSLDQGAEDATNGISSPERSYFSMYQNREFTYGIDVKTGFHKGAWKVSNQSSFDFDPQHYSPSYSADAASASIEYNYSNGDTFWIGASGPAFLMLNDASNPGNHTGYSLGEITVQDIEAIYGMGPRLKQYFNEVMPE